MKLNLKLFFCLLAMFLLIFLFQNNSYAANPYPYNNGYNCTYYAWQRAYEKLGISLPAWGDAGDWANNAKSANYVVDKNAEADCIVVWPRSNYYVQGYWYGYGHVAYVESVSNGQMTISESNWAGRQYNQTTISVSEARGYADSPQFIHLKPSVTGNIALDSVSDGTTFKARYDSNKNYMCLDGWAMSNENGAFLQIYVDNNLAVASHLIERYYRPDVSTSENVGYRVNYNYSDLSDGEHTLTIRLHSQNQGNVIAEKKIKFNVLHVDMSVDTIENGAVFYKHRDTSKNTFDVDGFAITKYKNSFVQFYLDDDSDCFIPTHNIQRCDYDGITGYTNPGYHKTINYSDIPLGEHTLKVLLFQDQVNTVLEKIEIKFTIKEEKLTFVSLNKQFNEINVTEQIKAKTSDGEEKIVNWESNNPKVVETSNNGYVTPKSGGFAKLNSTTSDPIYGTANVWVYVCVPVALSDGSWGYAGDLNGDKKITKEDAEEILNIYLKGAKEDDILLGDIDGNGRVNAVDSSLIYDIVGNNIFQIVE